eukprot:COSAG02_NODE_28854_length_581_cov_0.558091_1_plen_38_part_01
MADSVRRQELREMLRREGYTVRQRERVMWVPGTACPDP